MTRGLEGLQKAQEYKHDDQSIYIYNRKKAQIDISDGTWHLTEKRQFSNMGTL